MDKYIEKYRSENKWICTDPDNGRFRLDDGLNIWKCTIFRFIQGTYDMTIDLNHYSLEDINNIISSYGYIGTKKHSYWMEGTVKTAVSNDIIAECIFETEII